ncbi:GNAT family N-acetyltransferase [Catenulispora sp. NL8]|uniref:GNAT family N-acetyltransferase n=1 Tax=Catenulispora pinistramenti TaxID=2705254 RepID=A0ABS5KUC3_9ACTN|nr:GNAT family N-acetyltransferase [Catenulispora pinistramenti]MBS2549610.1 GNAT family N-acetyltransferase [Catenulispora pinistramenti]
MSGPAAEAGDNARVGGPAPDIRLRPVGPADVPLFFEYQRDPLAARLAGTAPAARRDHEQLWHDIRTDPATLARTVVVDGAVAGSITCWPQWEQRQVGYWFGRDHWGRGVATTALALFLCELTIRPVHAYVAGHNAASARVLEKCGFRRDGLERDGAVLGYILEA